MGGFLSGDPKQMLSPAYAIKKQGLKGISPVAYVMSESKKNKELQRKSASKQDAAGKSLLGNG
tara:strand:- start:294 stop:482 length:189 start_codon:yes stop_codon:yes gene_type:complete